jgi:hypothetical protein
MSVTAYASAGLSPYVSQVDAQVLQAALPTTVQFYGAGYDTSDPGATFTYLWSVVSQPVGSTAAFASTTAQNPLLNGVTDWGNIIVALVVTNTATTESSEGDVLLMPDTARCTVHVISTAGQLENTARGERNWFIPGYWPLVSEVDRHAQILATLTGSIQPGGTLQVQAGAALAAGDVVYPSGIALVGTETYLIVDKALATNPLVLTSQLFVMEAAVLSGALGEARLFGLSVINPAGAPAVLDNVYVSDTATLSLTAGTNRRAIGQVVQSSSGLYRFYVAGGSVGGASGAAEFLVNTADASLPNAIVVSDLQATLLLVDTVGAVSPGSGGAPIGLVYDKAAAGLAGDFVGLPMLLRNAHATPALTIAGGLGAAWVDPAPGVEVGKLQAFLPYLGTFTPVVELLFNELQLTNPDVAQYFDVKSERLRLTSDVATQLHSDTGLLAYVGSLLAWQAGATAELEQRTNFASPSVRENRIPRRTTVPTTDATPTAVDSLNLNALLVDCYCQVRTRVLGYKDDNTIYLVAERVARFSCISGTVTMLGSVYVPVPDDNSATVIAADLVVDGNFVKVEVTGIAATNLTWTAWTEWLLEEVL